MLTSDNLCVCTEIVTGAFNALRSILRLDGCTPEDFTYSIDSVEQDILAILAGDLSPRQFVEPSTSFLWSGVRVRPERKEAGNYWYMRRVVGGERFVFYLCPVGQLTEKRLNEGLDAYKRWELGQ